MVPVSASRFQGEEDYEVCLLAVVVNQSVIPNRLSVLCCHFVTVLSNAAHAASHQFEDWSTSMFVETADIVSHSRKCR